MAIYVSNLPMIWPLLRDWFPFLRTLTPGGYSSGGYSNGHSQKRKGTGTGATGTGNQSKLGSQVRSHARDILSSHRSRGGAAPWGAWTPEIEMTLKDRNGRRLQGDDSSSTEHIVTVVEADHSPAPGAGMNKARFDGIKVERTVVVEEVVSPKDNDEAERGIFNWKMSGGAAHSAGARREK